MTLHREAIRRAALRQLVMAQIVMATLLVRRGLSSPAVPAASAKQRWLRPQRSQRPMPDGGPWSSQSTRAKRLADALGIDELDNTPTVIEGNWPGTLGAMMLDSKATFDDVVTRHATSQDQVEHIFSNRFYVNISTELPGTQDYMAVEKLNELHFSGDWDLVVVDTPPTRDALAFFEAPKLLTRLLNNTIYKLLMSPRPGVLRAVNRAAGGVVRRLSRVVGAEVVDDAIEFFQTFQGMEGGFKQRADETLALLASNNTAFVLVASPRSDTIAEALYFLSRLADADLSVHAVVINRMLATLSISTDEGRRASDQIGRKSTSWPGASAR